MDQQEKTQQLKSLLEKFSPGLLDNRVGGLESMAETDQELTSVEAGLEMLANNRPLSPEDSYGLEAIVHRKFRPALFVVNNTYEQPPEPWTHLGQGEARENIEQAIPSIGRIEVPGSGRLYGGTGFIVGAGLIMTNRHVAEIFTRGIGTNNLRFKSSRSAAVNFRKEIVPTPNVQDLKVLSVEMIHPYWDMALLRVEGLPHDHDSLSLSTTHTDDLENRDIAVVGYPAQDRRNDLNLQNEIFGGVFNVKRMQPGKLENREHILSFGKQVHAVTHDASTLGGNSGSAVIDVQTGQILALHFAGLYLKANYAVPTFEMARDQRVVDAGVSFNGSIAATDDWSDRWTAADSLESISSSTLRNIGSQSVADTPTPVSNLTLNTAGGEVSMTIPLTVTISLGQTCSGQTTASIASVGSSPANGAISAAHAETAELEGLFGSNKESLINSAYQHAHVSELRQSVFTPEAALTAAAASALVYSDDASHIETICKAEFGFDTCKFFKQDNSECFVATSADTALVCFRGTQGIRDWIANMNIAEQGTQFGMVHGGFLQGFTDINDDIEGELDKLITGKQLVLTGHSLGGALSTIAASEWRNRYDLRSVWTFGQPAVGDREFRTSMKQYDAIFHRVVNDDDIVTRIPPPYRHVGTRIKLPPNKDIQSIGTESMHSEINSDAEQMISDIEFQLLQSDLEAATQSVGTEGILPSFSDHKIANYIGKLLKLSRIT